MSRAMRSHGQTDHPHRDETGHHPRHDHPRPREEHGPNYGRKHSEAPDPPEPPEPPQPPAEPLILFTAAGPDEAGGFSHALWASGGTAEGTVRLAPISIIPAQVTALGEGVAVFAGGPRGDIEPWVTDGTPEGTQLLRDIRPGTLSPEAPPPSFSFRPFRDGLALFRADDGVTGPEPWVTDGTAQGTRLLGDLTPGPDGSDFTHVLALGDELALFRSGEQLWVTDGTPAGTRPLGGVDATAALELGSGLVLLNGRDAAHGAEPWVTDGTPEGTRLLRDIAAGSSDPSQFTRLGTGQAIFLATDEEHGRLPWITDGTPQGTRLLPDLAPGTFVALDDGRVAAIVSQGGPAGGFSLWITDGTAEGTERYLDVEDASLSIPRWYGLLSGGRFLFGASDAEHGAEFWVSDGTAEGTRVLDATPGPGGSLSSIGAAARLGDGRVVFSGGGPLRVTDGTEEGTLLLVSDIGTPTQVGQKIPSPYRFVALADGRVAFTARHPEYGIEPWVTDGTPEGTRLLVDLTPGNWGSNPTPPAPLGDGRALFGAGNPGGYAPGSSPEVYVTDGTPEGTQIFPTPFLGGAQPHGFAALGDGRALYAATYSPGGGSFPSNQAYDELWVSDGTREGTRLVADIYPGQPGSRPGEITPLSGGHAVLSASTPEAGRELWVSDGTEAGTRLLADIASGEASSDPLGIIAFGEGLAAFAAHAPGIGTEAWVTDGTEAGTRRLADIAPGVASSDPAGFAALGEGVLLFTADDGVAGREAWISDGTEAGTRLLADIAPGEAGSDPSGFVALGDGRAVFRADDGKHGTELWVTDGTLSGTFLLRDLARGSVSGATGDIGAAGDGRALFGADDGKRGMELWVTDGTRPGTHLLADIEPGQEGSNPAGFLAFGDGSVLFAATDAAHGRELWQTNGTAQGTCLARDIEPGEQGSDPTGLALLREGVAVFVATDVAHGAEPWTSDGTTGGTRLIEDLVVFPNSSGGGDYISLAPAAGPPAASDALLG
ncbi:ELWxxDGT repeat protein [Falsiroseomonas sp.]|uniref:ELWxxDGT repeat protein n=1 Tax=Falsiroseomonas sp. TaxID=2870721 RepID=UPI003565AB88